MIIQEIIKSLLKFKKVNNILELRKIQNSITNLIPNWNLKDLILKPIVQGGMGIGVSASRLAGHVAKEGALGTISSVDLRHHHPDLLKESMIDLNKENIDRINLIALDREIKKAITISEGNGGIAVNIMKAVTEHPSYVRQSCISGADAIVMGAGLPFDLPDLTKDFPNVSLIPILSDSRGVNIILKKWIKKNRLPDAIIIESPRFAGGHLGAPNLSEVDDSRYDFPEVIADIFDVFLKFGLQLKQIPLIIAGGINTHLQVKKYINLGISAVQIGTPFAVTHECDAHLNFKEVLANATQNEIVTFMSVAGLPARAVLTPWLTSYFRHEKALKSHAKADQRRCVPKLNCLKVCGLRDGISAFGQFCIDTRLTYALNGDVKKGLFFRGRESLPFGKDIRSVHELINYYLTGVQPDLQVLG